MEDNNINETSIEEKDVTQLEGSEKDNEIKLPTTLKELQAMLQEEGEKRVTQAKKIWKEKQKEVIEQEKQEAVKLAKMSAVEREKAKYEKEKAEFEAQKAEFAKEQLKVQTSKELINENLPAEFADYVFAEDAEKINENIKNFKKLWDSALEKAIKERIATPTPKRGTSNINNKNTSSLMNAIKSKRAR